MRWETLLSTRKLADEAPEPEQFNRHPMNEFEKDFNKIVSSAAFRRLQDKTQVFPLDKSDFIRTRLTHSIEVSTIARQLGIMVTGATTYRPDDIGETEQAVIPSILLCAGLLHDLGNPPFGHFGEATIGEWFKTNLDEITYKGQPLRDFLADPQMIADLEHFEGNAQALRILLKSRFSSEINITAAVIGTLVKYPNDSLSFDEDSDEVQKHKPGFYSAEQETFRDIAQELGTLDDDGDICRHPLTYLLEAADDIAYATADLEDAFKKKLFTLDQFLAFYNDFYDHERIVQHRSPEYYTDELRRDLIDRRTTADDAKAFKDWLDYTRRWFMYVAAYRFSSSYQDIMAGNYTKDLFWSTNHSITIKLLKKAMAQFAFHTPTILKPELSAQAILSFLLDKFVHAVLYFDENYAEDHFVPSKADRKYMAIFSENYIQDYKDARTGDEKRDLYLRLLMVTDYVSGMTDSYARTLYRELSGIE